MAKLDGSERILCVPAENLSLPNLPGSGYTPIDPDPRRGPLAALLRGGRFLPRTAELEQDQDWRQVCAYVLPVSRGRVLVYRRGPAGSEDRLHGRLTVGGGGHVNDQDAMELPAALALAARNAARREVVEEFGLTPAHALTPCGLIVDDRDPVGRVHVGLVGPWRVDPYDGERIRFGAGLEFVGWESPAQAAIDPGRSWEGWSELLLPHLDSIVGGVDATVAMAGFDLPRGGRPGPRAVADAFAGSVPAGTEPYARAGTGAARSAAAALARLDGDRGRRRGR